MVNPCQRPGSVAFALNTEQLLLLTLLKDNEYHLLTTSQKLPSHRAAPLVSATLPILDRLASEFYNKLSSNLLIATAPFGPNDDTPTRGVKRTRFMSDGRRISIRTFATFICGH